VINVFTKSGFTGTWDAYLYDWQGDDEHDFAIRTYQDLATLDDIPPGPIIFGDIERLTASDRALAGDVARVVSETRPDIPILNNPTTTLRRYDLLTALHQDGLNPFRAYRLTDTFTPERFPVFIRYENDHTGATTGLLHSQRELERAIVRVLIRRHDLRDLIIVEFVDTSNASGLFAKYSTFKVGDVVVPRGVELSTEWVVKFAVGVKSPAQASAAFDYVRDNPHEHLLERRFDVGQIGYGRIDYAIMGNSVVTWEINTNPTIMSTLENTHPSSIDRQELFVSLLGAAFDALEAEALDPSPIVLGDVSEQLRQDVRKATGTPASTSQRLGRKYRRWLKPTAGLAEIVAIPFQNQILDRWRRKHAG